MNINWLIKYKQSTTFGLVPQWSESIPAPDLLCIHRGGALVFEMVNGREHPTKEEVEEVAKLMPVAQACPKEMVVFDRENGDPGVLLQEATYIRGKNSTFI